MSIPMSVHSDGTDPVQQAKLLNDMNEPKKLAKHYNVTLLFKRSKIATNSLSDCSHQALYHFCSRFRVLIGY
jgi:hypothetical protein